VRARVDGQFVELSSNTRVKLDPKQRHTIEVIVDRLVIDEKIRVRLSDSVETSLKWGEGRLLLLQQPPDARPLRPVGRVAPFQSQLQSGHRTEFRDAHAQTFLLQLPAGACPVCHGWGRKWSSTSA
jgi:excinuclease ABC subunit A